MSHKIKSFLFLSSFIVVFAIYSFSTANSNTYSDANEIAITELDAAAPSHNQQIENIK